MNSKVLTIIIIGIFYSSFIGAVIFSAPQKVTLISSDQENFYGIKLNEKTISTYYCNEKGHYFIANISDYKIGNYNTLIVNTYSNNLKTYDLTITNSTNEILLKNGIWYSEDL